MVAIVVVAAAVALPAAAAPERPGPDNFGQAFAEAVKSSELAVGDLVFKIAPPSDRKTIEIVVKHDASLVLKSASDGDR